MSNSNIEKLLKYVIWAGLIAICFVPLIVRGTYYFPYIVPKTVAFKSIILVVFLAYLWLAVINEKYRVKLNLVLVLFLAYLGVVFLSSLLGGSFYFSFWSNNERSEGLLLLLHLLLFLIVLCGFFRSDPEDDKTKLARSKRWLIIFEASFLSSILVSLYSLGQYFGWGAFIASSAGERLTATIGNAGYVAGYLIFNIFFGLILWFSRKNQYLRWYYGLGIILHIFIILNTLTRGGIIALSFSLLIFLGYIYFFYLKKNKIVKNTILVGFLLVIIFVSLIFAFKNASWVRDNNILERITSISAKATTAQNRLMTWNSAYQGFKKKPILGYGYENFYQVFDRYFNPKIYRKAKSVVWFDRAHNIVFDRLITGGIVGLLLYLSLLFVPVFYIWKYFYRHKAKEGYLIPLLFGLIILSYFIQNFFIFEALVTYIPLFIVLGFLSQFCPSFMDKFSQSYKPYLTALTVGLIAFLPVLFIFTIKPASDNREFISCLELVQRNKIEEGYDAFVELLYKQSMGSQEYRQHFSEFVAALANNANFDNNFKVKAAKKAEEELEKQLERKPQSARNHLMIMRFFNKTYQYDPNRLIKSLELFNKGVGLSPTRPMFYYEVAYSQIYLGHYYKAHEDSEKAQSFFDSAVDNMQKGIDLNDQVMESYINMIMTLFNAGYGDRVPDYLKRMDDIGLNYHAEDPLRRMGSAAVNAGDFEWTSKFYKELTEIIPDQPDHWVNLALSYALLKEDNKAIETARKVGEFGEDYAEQSELFIKDVLSGKYR